jgi:DNA polymerase I-like protein with 3'-5' exonuclease and polymerase domains
MKTRGKLASLAKAYPKATLREIQIIAHAGQEVFNINSKSHLKRLLVDILGEIPLSKTPTGQPQVNAEFLEHIGDKYSFTRSMVLLNKLNKIKSTYIERFLEEAEEGIFYPSYKMHGTTSGRLSGDFQQLSKQLEKGHPMLLKYNNNIREYFISRPGQIFVDLDYNSLEPRVFASVAGDDTLKDIFKNDYDFYSTIAKSGRIVLYQ